MTQKVPERTEMRSLEVSNWEDKSSLTAKEIPIRLRRPMTDRVIHELQIANHCPGAKILFV